MIRIQTICDGYQDSWTVRTWAAALGVISRRAKRFDHVSIRAGSYGTLAIVVFE